MFPIANTSEFEFSVVGDGGVCSFGFLTSSSATGLYRGWAPKTERLTILWAATHGTELGDHDFCHSRSHYTDTDLTSREPAATAGIEPRTDGGEEEEEEEEMLKMCSQSKKKMQPNFTVWIFALIAIKLPAGTLLKEALKFSLSTK